ncbi:formylglycine-generating enzyme family protein [Bradyrhizobium sp. dw_78]|uniref:formylglycine-generating enzyme family protein n=1 Tax=Bradyrhizobium sp. dw_78 TaxID=2719793 RepID=UPI001BD2D4C6|nr:formylglycine-generating enzyme family protein [Bradyrhizobium sp. dw_78]
MLFREYKRFHVLGLLAGMFASGMAQAEPAAGTTWTEPTTGMEFVWVPSGCFNQGSTDGYANEQPVHRVCVAGFYLGKYEVTQAQYEKIMGNNPSAFKGPNHPVEQVSWTDAGSAAEKLSSQSNTKMRLPSEAEWEYACRAGGQHDIHCGSGSLPDMAWYSDNSADTTHDKGGKSPNAWGLYDMNGNVWEWTQDCYHSSYQDAPADGSAWETSECQNRVTRGGGWNRAASRARATYRGGDGSSHRDNNIGFRLARTAP